MSKKNEMPKVAIYKFGNTFAVLSKKIDPFDEDEYGIIGTGKTEKEAFIQAIESCVKTHEKLKSKVENVIESFGIEDSYISDSFGIEEIKIPLPKEYIGKGEEECEVDSFSTARIHEGEFYPDSGVFMIKVDRD